MKLQTAFNINPGEIISLVGAGGKTSLLVQLGYELRDDGWRVLATTSTRIAVQQLRLVPNALQVNNNWDEISEALNVYGFVFLYDQIIDDKVTGIPANLISTLVDSVDSDVLIIEADGARKLPFKAPKEHEPVISAESSLVIPIASVSAIGKPLDAEHVYHPQAMIDTFGYYEGHSIYPSWIADVMSHPDLGLKGIPKNARVIGLLNQTPAKGYLRGRARAMARIMLRSKRYSGIAIGNLRSEQQIYEVQRAVGAVVLAAGMSTRMGKPKVLLPWGDKTILEHIIEQLLRSRIEEILVVTGANGDEVKRLLEPYGIRTVHNRGYKTGEMLSSLQTGLRAMPDYVAATMIVLGDQPRLHPRTLYKLQWAYAAGASELIAPSYQMRRGHPILIGRRYWQEILQLQRGMAPRDVINAHADEIAYVQMNDDSVIRDVDTPEQYQEERRRAGFDS